MAPATSPDPNEFARKINRALSEDVGENESLDMRIADYVRDELAGKPVAVLYPDVHAYIRDSDHASELYAGLMRMLDEDASAAPSTSADMSFDLSFLTGDLVRIRNARILALARGAVARLRSGAQLFLEDFEEAFLELRPKQGPGMLSDRAGAVEFGAIGGAVDEEIRWLEAAYQFVITLEQQPDSNPLDVALRAAANAGLPKALHAGFAELCRASV